MKKIYSMLISLALTITLLSSWFYGLDNLQVFMEVIYWVLSSIVIFTALFLSLKFTEFDEGNIDYDESISIFKGFTNKGAFRKFFNLSLSIANIVLLITIESPVLAAFYFLCCLVSIKLTSSCESRYKKALEIGRTPTTK